MRLPWILARRVGVALLPAILFAIWIDARRSGVFDILRTHRTKFIAGGLLVLLIGAGLLAVSAGHIFYLPDFHFHGGVASAVSSQLFMRLADFGELFLNLPSSKFAHMAPVILAAGGLLTLLIAAGLWRLRRDLHPTHAYFLVYLAIMAVWPFGDARFWIPVLPLIAIVVFHSVEPLTTSSRPVRWLAIAYLASFACLSVASMAYTTRITFSGPRFTSLYGDPSTQAQYHAAYSDNPTDPEDNWMFVIRRFGKKPSAH